MATATSSTTGYSKCVKVLLEEKGKVLYKLNEYSKLWDTYLDEKTDVLDTKKYIKYIKKQCDKIIQKMETSMRRSFLDLDQVQQERLENTVLEIKTQLESVAADILLRIKTREQEIQVFKTTVDIRKLLTEDTYILKEREKARLLKDLDKTIEECRPYLLDSKDLPKESLEKGYIFINNSLYYKKDSLKRLKILTDTLDKCEIHYANIRPDLDKTLIKSRVHQKFLTVNPQTDKEKELLVEYIKDNVDHYNNLDKELLQIYDKLAEIGCRENASRTPLLLD